MKVVGLTGGIACGKSKVLYILGKLGAQFENADRIAHEILNRSDVKEHVARRFGADMLNEEGNIDRKKLGELVFADPAKMKIHSDFLIPLINEKLHTVIKQYRESGEGILVVEIPLLFERGLEFLVDTTVVVAADHNTQVERLCKRDHLTEEQAMNRIMAQMPLVEKIKRADEVIWNNEDYDSLWDKVEQLYNKWLAG